MLTATGPFDTFGHTINLSVLGIETESTVYFAADESFYLNILGRQGWLDRVKLGLIDYEGKLLLSAYGLELKEKSLISEEEYETRRQKILDEI